MVNGTPKVAIVCDWLLGIGGAERVVLELHRLFPDAPIYTSQYDPVKINWFQDADVRTTWLQKLPGGLKKFLPVLRAWAFSNLDLSDYDLVISATGAEAKFVRTTPKKRSRLFSRISGIGPSDEQANTARKCVHICYCFAPTHYYWSRYDEYLQNPGFGALNWLAKIGLRLLVGPMRRRDKRAAGRPDEMVSISSHIQQEIKRYYGRESTVIFPPVNTERFQNELVKSKIVRKGFIAAGRQTPYKRFDLAVKACTGLSLPLIVIGKGPEHNRLRKMAGPTITFLTNVSDKEMPRYFRTAEAFIFPGLDDFGITPVEAMAAGTPVIAYKAGGALDYVVPGKTGEFFNEQSASSLIRVLQQFESKYYNQTEIQEHAEQFNAKQFCDKIIKLIKEKVVL